VTFTSGGATLCSVALPATSCQTARTLVVGTYPVTATYPGDSNFTGTSATGATFSVTKAPTTLNESAAPASIAYGSADTLSLSGLPVGATGTVTFSAGGSTLCVTTLPASSCQTALTLTAGVYTVTATYSGDSNYNGTTATGASFTVTTATTAMTESASPASIAHGVQDTLSVSGLPGGAAGTVTFTSGGSTLCTAILPATSCQTSAALGVGIYSVTATYSGDANHSGSTASGASFTVVMASTTFSESAAPSSIPYGTVDTLSINGLPGDATGTVTFTSGGATLCAATLPATSCTTSTALVPGVRNVTATYSGDANYNGSTATGASFTVVMANTTITESASPADITFGSQDTLSVSGLPGDATGTVTFTSGGATLCTATLPATSCTTATSLGVGTYDVTATYSGDGDYNGSAATGASFTVTVAATSMTESTSPASIQFGSADTLSVSGLTAGITGTVTFTSGGTTLCVATLPATSCETSASLGLGTYDVTATYSGDPNDSGTTATGASFTITTADVSITEAASPATIVYGAQDTLSVAGLPADATGTITFTSGGVTLCTATLPSTSCLTPATLTPGTYPITATYSGDATYNGTTVGGASFTVTRAATSITESAAPASIAYGAQDTLGFSGLAGDATGTVTFSSGGATLCTATLPANSCQSPAGLVPGVYDVTAAYSGDTDYTGSTGTGASFTITEAGTAMTESAAPASIDFGTQDTLSIAGLPGDATGTVTFTSGATVLCTATLPATTCQTSATLGSSTYDVTATYSGDGIYSGSTASGAAFTVVPAATSMTESAAPASVAYGTADTVSVSGLPAGATGNITFTSGSTTLCTVTLPATSCSTSATLFPGAYQVTATYSGDADYAGVTATGAHFTISTVTTSMSEFASPSTIVFGSQDTLSVTGLPGGATGTVTFSAGGAVLCAATLPATSCQTSAALATGVYAVTATYSGDVNYDGSTVTGAGFTITQASSSMTESASPPTIAYGSEDTLSVSGLSGTATGTVTFTSGGATLCTAILPAESCATSATLVPGTYVVIATYSGDPNNAGAVATGASFVVTPAPTVFTESAAPASVAYGTAVTLSVSGLPGDATGTITFRSGSTTLCTAILPATSCTTSGTLFPGTFPVTAAYSGDGNHSAGSATGASFSITRVASSMAEFASLPTVAYGDQDTLSVTGLPGGVDGTITFSAGGVTLCTATLPATSCQTSATLAPGAYVVTAVYSGDVDHGAATATGASFDETVRTTTMTESAAPATIAVGSADTLTIAGLPAGATGTVTFSAAGATLCVAILPTTTCPTSPVLAVGTYDVTATYSGDADNSGATATGASFSVVAGTTTMTESAALASVPYGTADTLTVAGLPAGATGLVTFTADATALCTTTLPAVSCVTSTALDVDAYVVTATYSGDTNHAGATATGATFNVVKATTSMTVTASPEQITSGSALTASVSGLPADDAGTVTFTIGNVVLCTATLPAISCANTVDLAAGDYTVRATYSGDDNLSGSTVLGSGVDGTFEVLAATTTVTTPDTGGGLLGWQSLLGALMLVAGISILALPIKRPRKRPAA
jgi:hypothetical protein